MSPSGSESEVRLARTVRRVAYLLGHRRWPKICGLLALSLVGSALEVLGIGIFLPYIQAVRDPEVVLSHERYGPILETLGLVDRNALVLAAGFGLLAVFAFKNGYLAFQWWLITRFVYREVRRLSAEIFEAYLGSPYLFHVSRNSSQMVRNVAAEAKHVFRDVLENGVNLVVEVVVFVGILAVLFWVNPVAAATGLVFMGLVAWALERLTRHRMSILGEKRAEATAARYKWVQQGLGAIKEIQILGRSGYFVRHFDDWGKVETEAFTHGSLAGRYPRLAIEIAAVVLLVSLITLPLLAGQALDAILGMLVVFGVAVIRLLPAVTKITGALNKIRFNVPSVDILYEELVELERAEEERRLAEGGPEIRFENRIEIEDVWYRYPDANGWALQEIEIAIERGESVGFAGQSGGGKTTLLHLLVGLLDPTRGRIFVDGRDIGENLRSWQREIGFVSQDVYLLDASVRRNVAFGVPDEEIDDEAVWRALEMAQLAPTVREMSGGLDATVGERGVGLSGGQRQRLAIARALYHDPPVLVLDEPTSSLDRETELQVERTITGLKEAKTILIVSHREDTLQNCDSVYVLEGGRVVRHERHREAEPQLR